MIMIHHIFDHCCDVVKFRVLFVKFGVIFVHFIIRSLSVLINNILRDKELFILLVIDPVSSTWHLEYSCIKGCIAKTVQWF